MGVDVSAVEALIRARVDAQLAALGELADVEARRVEVRARLAELDGEYAVKWAAAVKAEVPEGDLRKGGYVAPEVPVVSRKRGPRKRGSVVAGRPGHVGAGEVEGALAS